MRHKKLVAAVAAVVGLSGCQAPIQLAQMKQPLFALGSADDKAPMMTEGKPRVQGAGELTVQFQGELAHWQGRKVLATVADVDHVVVNVKAADGVEFSKTVDKVAIASGTTSVAFQGLAVGTATVSVTAYDATGKGIGSTSQAATVAAGQTSTVQLALQLAPSYVGGAGSSGGGLTTTINILNGADVTSLPGGGQMVTYHLDFTPVYTGADSAGNAWVSGSRSTASGYESVLEKIGPDGSVLATAQAGASLGVIDTDRYDHLWAYDGALNEYGSNGQLLSPHAFNDNSFGSDYLTEDALGNVWLSGIQGPELLLDSAGTVKQVNMSGTALAPGANNDVWMTADDSIVGNLSTDVYRYGMDGSLLGQYPVDAGYRSNYVAVDAAGNAWVTCYPTTFGSGGKGRLLKFSPTGQRLGMTELSNAPSANAVEIGPDGKIWVVSGGGMPTDGTVTWLSPQGTELGSANVAGVRAYQFSVGPTGAWVVGPAGTETVVVRLSP